MSTRSDTTHIPPTGGKVDALARRMAAWPSSQIVRTVGSFAGTISGTLAGIGVVMIFCITAFLAKKSGRSIREKGLKKRP